MASTRQGVHAPPGPAPTRHADPRGRAAPKGGMRVAVACGWLIVLPAAGLLVDLARGRPPGAGLGVGLLVASVLVAVRIRQGTLITAVIAPPLVTVVAVAVAVGVRDGFGSVRAGALSVATQLALLAPWLWGATVLAGVIVLVRRVRRRRPGAAGGAARAAARTADSPPPR